MNFLTQIFLVTITLTFLSCSTIHAPKALPGTGIVALKTEIVTYTELTDIFPANLYPSEVFFIKIEEGENPLTKKEILFSNYLIHDGVTTHALLLNAKPGTYAAVGARVYSVDKNNYTHILDFFFPKEFITKNKVTLHSGSVAHMGYAFFNRPTWKEEKNFFKPTQKHYLGVIQKMGNYRHIRAYGVTQNKVHKSPKAEKWFLKKALSELEESGWKPVIQKKLIEMR